MDTLINIPPMNPGSGSQRSSVSPESGGGLPAKPAGQGQVLPPAADKPIEGAAPERPADLNNSAVLADQIEDAVQRINEFFQVVQRDLQFTVDDSTGRTVVKVFDSQSEELIRQLPPDELLAVAEYMDEVRGMLVKDKA
ncbi:flagellar protein FlaG [Ectothiorhodospira marina]|uniref:Flagellar protein FlaG n=1 Tax=Ectothiorhodospira marina TaxID=1396821 RepID=A0A1H7R4L5_9GAMM|nr:flagellar protein FlaG [Ectothiorhodospira marina]